MVTYAKGVPFAMINEGASAASDARSSAVWWKNLSMRGPTRPRNAVGELISLRLLHPISRRSSQGERFIQASLITVGIDSFGVHPGR